MTDEELVARINELVDEEHKLERSRTGEGLSDDDARRLRELEVSLDQTWDLLRQRRARRDAGLDPDGAQPRDPGTVEGYRQ
ncbi:DUF2630 family protein [Saccharothrix coeruleofusca]|uniref:DUF2630 family protein n=1 Tax=Saccharothrix coeruleofusca TaxID=33919 RepID=A0A918EI55_9PSEU|nr:DUF2630 family protein [Saccharothrix coeruleofusca]MBP2338939.1 hypothetical protein [Saccharothrix coeruleofusca]GGP83278.1 hypothetical protein GCM10010185_66550 [Saccharothrix coeruleofusca]